MEEPRNILKVVIPVIVAVLLLPLFAGFSFGGTATFDPYQGTQEVSDKLVGEPQQLDVEATTGKALRFDGDDHVDIQSQNFSQGSWTVVSAVRLHPDTNRNDTYDVYAWGNGSLLLQYDAGQWSVYYENATGADAKATIDAPSPSDGLTTVGARYNETENELVVVHDGTVSDPVALDNDTTSRNLSRPWNGTIDEVRGFDAAVNNSTLDTYADDPIAPLPNTNRSSRYMFDEGEGGTTKAYFIGGDVDIDGATWTDGVPKPGLSEGTDYEIKTSPLRLVIPAGSYLIGAPSCTSRGSRFRSTSRW